MLVTHHTDTFDERRILMPSGSVSTGVRDEQPLSAVVAWRRDQLVAAGFPHLLAVAVARNPSYDLHDLLDLVQAGCAPELAVRIRSPIDEEAAAAA
jgi:hypothetical protein